MAVIVCRYCMNKDTELSNCCIVSGLNKLNRIADRVEDKNNELDDKVDDVRGQVNIIEGTVDFNFEVFKEETAELLNEIKILKKANTDRDEEIEKLKKANADHDEEVKELKRLVFQLCKKDAS